jgi:hypothetical protein
MSAVHFLTLRPTVPRDAAPGAADQAPRVAPAPRANVPHDEAPQRILAVPSIGPCCAWAMMIVGFWGSESRGRYTRKWCRRRL